MKKIIAMLLVLGLSFPVMADGSSDGGLGQNTDDNVECSQIFHGTAPKQEDVREGDSTAPQPGTDVGK
ncbi:hypothetical protein BIY24_00910 [Halobacteriovorax marinus]|uniref:Exported protein n=1 Tax=Halobacteriovorax marinus (strain ATCC BAA-682 / DSM 15412 / SJ) TaxID=862908 RepID=E1X2S2_HALMS|nr:hypothetical protein [Halobacteriovorax marinus]ATH06551.1 hypothetical protein BIY24_00910 [Halobacteriovorax marinus]CBW25117.1 putative exported protein [Halobacteriovorax marinus SJ]